VTWRFEHALADLAVGPDGWRFAAYRGRYLRHSRSGHLMLPGNRRVALHSDVGLEVGALAADGRAGDPTFRLNAVRAAILADLWRSPDFTRRFSLGLVARWDLMIDAHDLTSPAIAEQMVAPLTMGVAALHLESQDGLTLLDLTCEGGELWSNLSGLRPSLAAEGAVERVVLAVNDRPFSLYLAAGWDDQRGARAVLGVRLGLVGR
jgi:hypothetical protein